MRQSEIGKEGTKCKYCAEALKAVARAVVPDVAEAKEAEVLYENEHNDVSRISYSRKDKKILSASYTAAKSERHFFDVDAKATFDEQFRYFRC